MITQRVKASLGSRQMGHQFGVVVTGDRKIAERMFDADQPQEIYHHSTHIPVNYSWPKRLAVSNHNTFKNWFTVAENRRATQLAEQIIDNPLQGINPLVVVGQKIYSVNPIFARNRPSVFANL